MLEEKFGKAMTPVELASFLGVDRRTVMREVDRWGGVTVSPGRVRFFEKLVMEVIDADLKAKARPSEMDGPRQNRYGRKIEVVSRRQPTIRESSYRMGSTGEGKAEGKDPFGLCRGA